MAENSIPMSVKVEQAETHLQNCAFLFGSYYKSLLENGIPVKLAGQMLVEYQDIFMRPHNNA